ncbi:Golgin subfamily A member 7/ERF4 family-domain-containing protein [Linnemannia elongata]|nr:Golgin subfamily A member 7/ERF4 family-domain-containing protein [Linnemannia elongata]
MASQWQQPITHTSEDLNSIPIQQLPLDPSSTTTHASESDHTISANSTVEHLASKIASTQTWSHPNQQSDDSPTPTTGTKTKTAGKTVTDQNRNQQSIATAASPRSPGTAPTYPTALGPDTSVLDRNRIGAADSSRQQQQAGGSGGERRSADAHPTGTPRVIVRIDRDHNIGDEATRFECEQFPEEMLGRVTRAEFKRSVEGINSCMEVAEESLWNCFDTLLDCLSAYTAKHCCGTHYQRSIRKMEAFIQEENRRVYHPARMHLRDPQSVGMIYLEFELF